MANLLNDRDLQFLLYEFLDTEALLKRPRYADHSRETFDATLDTARQIAEELFAPHNAKGDANEPQFDGERVHLVPETKAAWDAFAQAGFLSAHWDEDEGGLQMPEVVLRSAIAYFKAANVATSTYSFLSIGSANLLRSFGTPEQKARFLAPMGDGRFSGTMALTEPGQGSALGDITTRAELQPDGTYRLFGQKMFISGGDHNLTDNIVHMVLARIKGAPAGVKGISLFLVPKYLVNEDGSMGERNDVTLAGLLHKMGWRNATSTVLSFGERGGAVGTLVGDAGKGLAHMFQMMNEARIGIGMCAAAIAYRAYWMTLEYARERPQGRLPSCKDPLSPQVKLIRHADVRRMLLAQKAYAEGALAMCLYASSLFEDQHTHPDDTVRRNAGLLLDLVTPVVKSWASKYGCASNDLAIQILGGSGYIREYPQEQLYRDQRLNPIHEGAEAIHGIDLLGRKVVMQSGAAYQLFRAALEATLEQGRAVVELAPLTDGFAIPLARLDKVTAQLVQLQASDPDRALANATIYLDAFGRLFAAWIWLKQALAAQRGLAKANEAERAFYHGKLHAARYYCHWELPATLPQFDLLADVEDTPLTMQDAWF
ncbi:acyl-CoA dehydrogenase [Noviherbaspirillum saxi]|uniref:Acyl-CoA dehydrogenase n=1 Tax=Noviherbaspirillum saxi TaxID=2320863 RepID=A0A3A3G2S7_9BURK|nr:acyl-CoA dehydrogenase [Noviherbaspirillum saxi]RJF95726.1 acyl-CoA dehydrogenase [Noviherbaspirillum saxi]